LTDILPPWSLLTAFLAASFVLAVIPGPGVFYVLVRSLTQGRTAGLASVAGLALGNFGNAVGASLGLAALLAVSATAFLAVKWTGALYLVWLGVKAIRGRGGAANPAARLAPGDVSRVFRDGFIVALLNPKTAIFFAAFLPQFMGTDSVPALQGVVLGALFVGIAAVTDTIYALAAGTGARVLTSNTSARSAGRYLTGGALIGLGLMTALSGGRVGK
jgi:threonine/homoserine/homoserine lactone efflux protein